MASFDDIDEAVLRRRLVRDRKARLERLEETYAAAMAFLRQESEGSSIERKHKLYDVYKLLRDLKQEYDDGR